MADEKISQLTDAGAPQDTDQLVIARSGSSLSILFSAIKAAIPGGVTSVFTRTGAVTAQTGDYTAAQVGALPSTETLDQIAAANVTAADWSNNSHKITSLANGSGAQDAAAFGQIPTALPPNGSAGGDLSGTYPNPAIGAAKVTVAKLAAAVTLDAIATANATGADVSVNSHKITNLANGSGAQDAASFGQIPTALPPNGTAGGDLSGTYPNPAVKAITETSGPTDLTIGTVTDGQFLKRVGSTLVSATPSGGAADQYPNTYLTVADETIPTETQVIYEDYLELAASFEYELAVDALLIIGDFATPLPAPDQNPNIFITANDETTPRNSQVIYEDYLELGAPFAYEVGLGGDVVLATWAAVGGLVKLFDSTLAVAATGIDTGAGGIPAGHGDLIVVSIARTTAATIADFMNWTVNGDVSAIYDTQNVTGTASVAGAGTANTQAGWEPFTHGANGGAGYPGTNVLFLPGYDQTAFWKAGTIFGSVPDTGTGGFSLLWAVGYRSTAPISRLLVAGGSTGATNLVAGSRLVIYGTQ